MTRRAALAAIAGAGLAQKPVEFVCPMDTDIRSPHAGRCRRCGMKLVAGLPDPIEYPVSLETRPRKLEVGKPCDLIFRVRDPRTLHAITKFERIHEKLFHLFLVNQDLVTFAHEHPELQPEGSFRFRWTPPVGGEYRLLMDFYPEGATPQLITRTLLLPVADAHHSMGSAAGNLSVSLRTEPERPLAGQKTMLFFKLDPGTGLEPYLGAWGHLLAASEDLVDMLHAHPAWEEGGPTVQFNLIFPRPGLHRVWAQFQRSGVVNTVAFNVGVGQL